jgi:UDP-N-acetylmuramoyl-L-alanyl-D-glutamate--2,6-diaminopimelate ligase
VTLRVLLQALGAPQFAGDEGVEVRGLASDSRRVRPGDLFFALAGLRQDGQAFVRQALASGAVAAVVAHDAPALDGPLVRVAEPRRALAEAAATFHGQPARALRAVGITGTNGKTTTTYLLESVFRAAGWRPGVLGTTGARLDGATRPIGYTTPEATELQALLREMVDAGVQAVALELSSHALVQRRGYGLDLDVALFTNLSHDHLDYHGTLEAYLDAKLMLFDGRNVPRPVKSATAVVNADDPVAERVLAAARRGGMKVLRFGAASGTDVRIAQVETRPEGLVVEFAFGNLPAAQVRLPLLGRYNAWNAAGAFAAALALGVAPARVSEGLAAVEGVPGRLERIATARPFEVVVDYAHTPDALQRSLAAMREHAGGRVLLVFGCGGERDRAKRPVMGRAARTGADEMWVTSDNPRGEDPAVIAEEILVGAGGARGPVHLELDRRTAIARALAAARPGDAVLIAGKGHETTQTLGESVLPFDDREVARELLREGGRG